MTGLALASLVVACGSTGTRVPGRSSAAPARVSAPTAPRDELDARLGVAPSTEGFAAIRSWIEGQPEGRARDAALARALAGLQRWPDATRWAPEDWVYALARGEVHPLWPLIRRVDASFLDEQKFEAIFSAPAMATRRIPPTAAGSSAAARH